MIAQEGSSVSNTDETELDQLPQNIVEEFQEASVNYKKDMTEKQEKGLKNRWDAKEVRPKAQESLTQTKKTHTKEGEQSHSSNSRKRAKKNGSETMLYLQNKVEKEFWLKKRRVESEKRNGATEKQLQNKPQQLKIW